MQSPAAPSPRLSVLISCFNYRDFVCQAVDSALTQTWSPEEVVVVDDGSTDGSPELLDQVYAGEPRVRVIRQANAGQLAAFTAGAARVRGDIVCLLDADDWWEPNYLAQLASAYAADPQLDFTFSNIRILGGQEATADRAFRARDCGYSVLPAYFLQRSLGARTSALALRRGLLSRLVDLPSDFCLDWKASADACVMFGASVLGARKRALRTDAVNYRVHGHNAWFGKKNELGMYRYHLCVQRLLAHYGQRAGIGPQSLVLAKREFRTLQAPSFAEARDYLWLASRAPMSWIKRIEACLGILWHWVRHRSRAV